MKVLTILTRIFLLLVVASGPVYATYLMIKKQNRLSAPKQDQNWEDIKQTFPEYASDLDTPDIIAERRRVAADASR